MFSPCDNLLFIHGSLPFLPICSKIIFKALFAFVKHCVKGLLLWKFAMHFRNLICIHLWFLKTLLMLNPPMKGDIFLWQVTARRTSQSLGWFVKSSECLYFVFLCVPIRWRQALCSPRLLTRFKLKIHCMATRRMQLDWVTCQSKQGKGINVSWGLHVLHMI